MIKTLEKSIVQFRNSGVPSPSNSRKPSPAVLFTKRILDIIIGTVGIFFFLLAYPIIALLIKLESSGPVIYKQMRVGINKRVGTSSKNTTVRESDVGGKPFYLYKFRSMAQDAEKSGPQLAKMGGDMRITKVGKWLRILHLDELPQFWNILKGDMSFIGPRPERSHFTLKYQKEIPNYSDRTLYTKPGLTGLAQIILGYDDSMASVIRKSYFDLAYCASLANFSSWVKMEFWVFLNTFKYILKRSDPQDVVHSSDKLENIKNLPFGLNDSSRDHDFTSIMRFNSFNINVVHSDLDSTELNRRLNVLSEYGQKEIEVTINPGQRFDLEDLSFLVNLVHKIKDVKGTVKIRNANPHINQMLKELHLDKTIEIEPIENTVTNLLTVDVECWFHAHNMKTIVSKGEWDSIPTRIVENIDRILELLKKHDTTATFYILGWVAKKFPEVVQMIHAAGQDIGTHGYYHNFITEMTPMEFEDDLTKSMEELTKLTSKPIISHRASNFTVTKSTLWALDIMAKHGIEYDSSIFPVKRNRYGIGDYPNRMPHKIELDSGRSIYEIPLSTLAMGKKLLPIAGGGFLRLYPYRVTHQYIDQMNKAGLPAVVYFHPWELDTKQKKQNVRLDKKFQHYVNMDSTDWKLSHLMERFKFGSLPDTLKDPHFTNQLKNNLISINLGNKVEIKNIRSTPISTKPIAIAS